MDVVVGIARAQRERIGQGEPVRDVAVERIVGAGLVGHQVRVPAAARELRQDVGGVPTRATECRCRSRRQPSTVCERLVEVVGQLVEVAGIEALAGARLVHLDDERGSAVHRDRQRLGAAHAAQAAR